MTVYPDLMVLLNLAINYCLLSAANLLTGGGARRSRLLLGALVGALYAGATVLPGLGFLGNNLWRGVFLGLMAMAAFGLRKGTVAKAVAVLGLSFLLGGVAMALEVKGFWPLVAVAAVALGLTLMFCRRRLGHAGRLVPVTVSLGEKQVKLTALYDTGNTLRDPFTGEPVLVVQASAARALLGAVDLDNPAPILARWKGKARLLPYKAVGGHGVLLAVRCDRVVIDGKQGGSWVAFSREKLSPGGTYDALTGGNYV